MHLSNQSCRFKYMKNNVKEIAKYFIYLSNKEARPVTNKKLQKLLYYAQAWYLVQKGEKLYEDDIEAWVHGPTIPHMYRQYKKYGYQPITGENIELDSIKITGDVRDFLDNIWKLYGNYDADYLELLTHQEDPWILAREGVSSGIASKRVIDTNLMKDFYSKLLERVQNEEKKSK